MIIFFQFNEQFYKQKFGSAIVNPISPILADIVMQNLETYALNFVLIVFSILDMWMIYYYAFQKF